MKYVTDCMCFQSLNLARKAQSLTTRLDDHKRLVAAILTHDIPSVSPLIRVALCNNRGPKEILHCIELAVQSLYHVKSFEVRFILVFTV